MKKLIVIGNGFDLHAGLRSSFSDFFNESEKPMVESWLHNSFGRELNGLNLISLLLYNSFYRKNVTYRESGEGYNICFQREYHKAFGLTERLVDWMDVEGFIDALLRSRSITELATCYEKIMVDQSSLRFDYQDHGCICRDDELPLFFAQATKLRQYPSSSFYDFLYQELRLFEKRFADYLRTQLNNLTQDHQSKVERMFAKLSQPHSNHYLIVMNFNYTSIGDRTLLNEFNVHGSLKNDIIIGIDDGNGLGEGAYQFTKTFRKLICPDCNTVLEDQISEIVIYGHSLGKQDYSYFQSVFDYANIYNSKTKVKFVYSDDYIEGDAHAKNLHRIRMAKKLFALMKSYDDTLKEKDSGRNLIHKMILEGRLSIELDNFD